MKFTYSVLIILLSAAMTLYGQDEPFQEALSAYKSGDFERSIQILEGLLKDDHVSEELYYNLGLSYLESNDLSSAIANFHRVLLIEPGHSEAQSALEFAEEKVTTPITEIPDFILYDQFVSIAESMSINAWSVTQLLLLLILIALVYLILFKQYSLKTMGTGAVLTVVLAVWSLANAHFLKGRIDNPLITVIKSEDTEIYSGADSRSDVVAIVGEGVIAHQIDVLNDWFKIELADKDVGWVQKEKVIIIE